MRGHNTKMRSGLGRVSAAGMYRSIEHVKFPKFQTGIFVERKVPEIYLPLACKVVLFSFSCAQCPFAVASAPLKHANRLVAEYSCRLGEHP